MSLGKRVQAQHRELGLSQGEFARRVRDEKVLGSPPAGASQGSVSNYIRGRAAPPVDWILAAARVLRVDPYWLRTGEADPDDQILPWQSMASRGSGRAAFAAAVFTIVRYNPELCGESSVIFEGVASVLWAHTRITDPDREWDTGELMECFHQYFSQTQALAACTKTAAEETTLWLNQIQAAWSRLYLIDRVNRNTESGDEED